MLYKFKAKQLDNEKRKNLGQTRQDWDISLHRVWGIKQKQVSLHALFVSCSESLKLVHQEKKMRGY
jgi:hypothetical protein